ncbi:MAG TPA: hypothetical protein VHK70_01825 [Burkholderiaceae bacterium]|nr:hypothetical protein [Burkholderiaceae bacterium]
MNLPPADTAHAGSLDAARDTGPLPVFTLREVSKTYTMGEVQVKALRNINLELYQGEFVVLLEGWGGGQTLRARVRLVEPVAFTKVSALGVEEQRVNVIADPIDPLGALGDGYRVEARIIVWAADQVTKVPGSSLFRVGDAWHVFVVQDGRAHERAVTVGQRNQDEAQIVSGLARGTQIVRYPSNELRDGVRVATPGNTGQ